MGYLIQVTDRPRLEPQRFHSYRILRIRFTDNVPQLLSLTLSRSGTKQQMIPSLPH